VCVAKNSAGTAMNQVRLDVQGKTIAVCLALNNEYRLNIAAVV
jgi:hypothetical protein